MWRTFGHDRAVTSLRHSLAARRVPHAYLIAGPHRVGKMTLAMDLCKAVNCLAAERPCGTCVQCQRIERGLHADVHVVDIDEAPEGKPRTSISIGQVRTVQHEASLKPFEGVYRAFVFDGAERMTLEAANSLLKILEEPPDQVLIVLVVAQIDALLPTLVSRCRVLELRPVSPALLSQRLVSEYGLAVSHADEIARLSGGRPGWAIAAASSTKLGQAMNERLDAIKLAVINGIDERFTLAARMASSFSKDRESGREDLRLWASWWRDVLLMKVGICDPARPTSRREALESIAGTMSLSEVVQALRSILDTGRLLERNVSPRLALESMMLQLPFR